MIESKLRHRAQRQHPLPRYQCEHVTQGSVTVARILRDGAMLSVCSQCWTKQDLLKLTVDGKVVEVER